MVRGRTLNYDVKIVDKTSKRSGERRDSGNDGSGPPGGSSRQDNYRYSSIFTCVLWVSAVIVDIITPSLRCSWTMMAGL